MVGAQKISDTAGGFTAQLDEEDQFGRSIVNLGDLDGDGVGDLLVGAHTDDDGGLDQGAVYVLFLHPNGFVKAWTKISDTSGGFSGHLDPGDQFGRAACSLGDLDLDGVVDVAVGSNYDDDGGTNQGAIYILFLNADGTVRASQKISETQGGLPVALALHDEFGRSLTSLGDLDGDGIPDLVVGTPEDDDGGTNTGALHVLFLERGGTVKAHRRISRSTDGLRLKAGDWFGFCSTNLGDFDGDGVTDLAVGAVLDDDGGFNQGSLWILLLNADGSVKRAHEINELTGGFDAPLDDIDHFGTSVASLGDLDGNGVTDLIVGAVKDDDGGLPGNADADVGAAYVLFLRADATVESWVKIGDASGDLPYDLDSYDWFGSAVARLGGAPLDGLFNVAIGCRNDDDGSPNRGAIYLVQLNDGTAPVADFGADRTLGVAPLTVSFTDQSANEVTSRVWSFGDGSQSSLQQPTKTFAAPGIYDVQLSVRGPRGKDVEEKLGFVTVVAGPLADFAAQPASGMAPLGVQFADRSQGEVSAWSWDFGDGTGSSERAPFHLFAAGTFDVALTVSGPSGTHTTVREACVVAEDLVPAAAFEPTPATGFAPLDVQFTDGSSGLITAWAWDFGDGTTSGAARPAHRYALPGVYPVTLTVQGPYGSDALTRVDCVTVASPVPVAGFDAAPDEGFAPLAVQFEDRSTGHVTSWWWDFGDGATASTASAAHLYESAGSYTVTLAVSGPEGTDVETQVGRITVSEPPPRADFGAAATAGFAPFAVQFSDQSSGLVTARQWDFGDGAGSDAVDPEHSYALPGRYTVRLSVVGPSGSDTAEKGEWIVVADPTPVAAFDAPMHTGIAPLAVQFSDASAGHLTSWWWDFGDGATSAEREPEHVYAVPGTYDVRLTVAGPAGSDDELRPAFVEVAIPPPGAAFEAAPTTGTAPLAVQFTDASSGLVSAWSWSFGDGATSSERSPQHVYTTPGTYDVSLTATGPAGIDVETREAQVLVQWPAPVPEFTFGPAAGFAPLPVAFTDLSTGPITSWSWSFGDGSSSRQRFPVKNYLRAGQYTVRLTVKGPGGTRSVSHGGISVVSLPALVDGGFELDAAGRPPTAPWSVVAGSAIVVRSSLAPDGGFPREGAHWCELGAEGSTAATPPGVPGGEGTPPAGAAGIQRTFAFAALAPHLVLDAAFLLGDEPASAARNDFMSVDLSDGARSVNVFYADGFSALPAVSAQYGWPMTAAQRVHVDLRQSFPGLADGTPLTLLVSVGNGGDDLAPSRGYVDSFRLVPAATAAPRNGTGRNALRYSSSPAVLGGAWTIQVDTTGHLGATSMQLLGMQRPASGTLKVAGEVLIGGKKLFAQSWPVVTGLNVRTLTLPVDLALLGQFMATQVTIYGGGAELCNAVDLVLGF